MRRPALLILLCALLAAGCVRQSVPPGQMRVTVMDIGEAECVLIQTSSAACLVDAGGPDDGLPILRALRANGVRALDLVVLSHPHTDHIGGLLRVGRAVPVRRVLDSGCPMGTEIRRRLMRWLAGSHIPVYQARSGQKVSVGPDLRMEILWPPGPPGPQEDEAGVNNNSVVLRVNYGKVYVLLAGDLQAEGEEMLLARRVALRADLLKVSHQGSAGSSSPLFLSRVRPAFAVIQTGRGNPYGHPAPATLERLRRAGARVSRTDRDGDVVYESDGRTIWRVSPP